MASDTNKKNHDEETEIQEKIKQIEQSKIQRLNEGYLDLIKETGYEYDPQVTVSANGIRGVLVPMKSRNNS